jgi:predicted transcriptional regulator
MRTTIELSDAHRARLLEIAATRGQKGFSAVIEEAVAFYLEELKRRDERAQSALAARGALRQAEADELESRVHDIHERWR